MNITIDSLHQVIEELEEAFPDQLPKTNVTDSQIHRLIGQQDVIRYLKQHLEKLGG